MDNNKSSVGRVSDSLSEADLKRLVVEAIAKGASEETYHALYGHTERNIQTDDVLYALRASWKKFKVQQPFNKNNWQWKYRILSDDVDGRELLIIIAVDTANREFEVVTRWPEKEDSV